MQFWYDWLITPASKTYLNFFQEDEITQFNKKKAQVQAQRAQTELMANNINKSGHHGKK